jgi:branched-subunit amino acid transport protein AzlD
VTSSWAAVLALAVGAYALKALGWLVPASALEREPVRRAAVLLPVALLAALVVVQVLGDGRSLTVDARLAGLAAGAVALALRAPFLVVVGVAAATAALLRALV